MKEKLINWVVEQSKKQFSQKRKLLTFVFLTLPTFFLIFTYILFVLSQAIDGYLDFQKFIVEPFNFLVSPIFIGAGGLLIIWTNYLQYTIGKGTAIPAMPTQKLVIRGPYAFSRNPMMLGVLIYQIGFAIFFGSISWIFLTLLLIAGYTTYIIKVEEKELELRFGQDYLEYKKKVPFLIKIKKV